ERRKPIISAQAFYEDQTGYRSPRAGRLFHGLRLRNLFQPPGRLLRNCGTRRVQSVLWSRGRDVRLLPCPRDLGLRIARMEGQGRIERDVGIRWHARLAGDVRGDHETFVSPAGCGADL